MKRRHGFTLLELLMVMLMISLLLALVIPAVSQTIVASRAAATKTTIVKIDRILQKRQDALNREFASRHNSWFARNYGRRFEPANMSHIAARKNRFNEIFLADAPIASAADSAEVLYRLVMESDESGASFTGTEVGDTDGDGNLEFLDGWGNPIRYYPHASRIFRPGGHPNLINKSAAEAIYGGRIPTDLAHDHDDPLQVMDQTAHNEGNFRHDWRTHHPILIVSAGASGNLGLYEPHDGANNGHMAEPIPGRETDLHDNITNLGARP